MGVAASVDAGDSRRVVHTGIMQLLGVPQPSFWKLQRASLALLSTLVCPPTSFSVSTDLSLMLLTSCLRMDTTYTFRYAVRYSMARATASRCLGPR